MNREQAMRELEEARQAASDRRSFERYQALLLWWEGYSPFTIGEIIGRSSSTVHNDINAYKEHGIPGLQRGKSTGKPSK